MRIFLLLVLLVCAVAYVREQQPATWNSWMVALGANSAVVATSSDDSTSALSADVSTLAPAPPPRVIPVGGQIQDGNFSAGNSYWQGDGQSDASGKGRVVTLSQTSWTRVYQTFASGATTLYSIEVTYKVSPGLAFSRDPADYTDISKHLQIDGFEDYHSMEIPPGNCYGTLGDPSSGHIACEIFAPAVKVPGVLDYQHSYPAVAPNGNKTFALAFPPGTGTITLLTAYVTSQ